MRRWESDSCTAMARRRRLELGEPDEQQAQAVSSESMAKLAGQQAKIFEDIVAQVLRLVDDEHGELLGLDIARLEGV